MGGFLFNCNKAINSIFNTKKARMVNSDGEKSRKKGYEDKKWFKYFRNF